MRLTYQQARSRENRPICRYCFISCDPRSREYRGMTLCSACYRDEPLSLVTQHKELLPCQTSSAKAQR